MGASKMAPTLVLVRHIKRMRVTAAGQSQDYSFDITGRSPNNMGWTTHVWSFTAVDQSTTLEFYSLDTEGGDSGPALDDVIVSLSSPPTQTPTPTLTQT